MASGIKGFTGLNELTLADLPINRYLHMSGTLSPMLSVNPSTCAGPEFRNFLTSGLEYRSSLIYTVCLMACMACRTCFMQYKKKNWAPLSVSSFPVVFPSLTVCISNNRIRVIEWISRLQLLEDDAANRLITSDSAFRQCNPSLMKCTGCRHCWSGKQKYCQEGESSPWTK